MHESLILLVGSNPLPNYLAAMALKPTRIHFVYSSETEKPKDRLRDAIVADLKPGANMESDIRVSDASDASDVAGKVAGLMSEGADRVHLHYTGGTKVMSAHALHAFYKNDGRKPNASYLDEANVRLRFDDGRTSSLLDCGIPLSLERLLDLHGIVQKPRPHVDGGPTQSDIATIATAVLKDPALAKTFYDKSDRLKKLKDKPSKAHADPFDPAKYSIAFSVAKVPETDDWSKERFKTWWRFLGGDWLEEWVAQCVGDIEIAGISASQVVAGINCIRLETGREFEVDAVAIRGQRSYFISCTTDQTLGLCKSKAFEIAARSRQMGGDLSRSALICLLHGDDSKGKFVDQLRDDVADVWGATNTTRIFGLEDVRTWAGHYGSPNLDGLKEWLAS